MISGTTFNGCGLLSALTWVTGHWNNTTQGTMQSVSFIIVASLHQILTSLIVDWVAVSGMNWGTTESWFYWISVVDLFDSVSQRIKAVSGGLKPFGRCWVTSQARDGQQTDQLCLGISEVSTVSVGKGVVGKDQWLRSLYTWVEANKVRMVNYFNMDKGLILDNRY